MQTAAVILAAGFSRRLGSPKQAALVGTLTLLERAVRVAQGAGLSPVLVVVQGREMFEKLLSLDAEPVINPDAAEGMASSVRHGVAQAQVRAVSGVVVMTCDQPLLRAAHLQTLCAWPQRVTASAYGGRNGVPAYFPASVFPALLRLSGDTGARELLRTAEGIQDESLALDVDTAEDLEQARKHLEP